MKKIGLLTATICLSCLSANAFTDVQYMSSEQYMLNNGYSGEMSKLVEINTRDPYLPTDDKFQKRSFKNFAKAVWRKVDSSAFPDDNFIWHNIRYYPSVYDL